MEGLKAREPLVARLMEALEARPGHRFKQDDILAMGLDPSTVRRAFQRQFGMSFIEIARQKRLALAAEQLSQGGDVIGAQIDAGFESSSGFRAAVNQLIGEAPQRLRGKPLLKADWIETAIGPMLAIVCAHALHLLEFAERQALPTEIRRLRERNNCGIVMGRTTVTDRIEQELSDYFAGRSGVFTTPLAEQGTPFERLVWQGLREIPLGQRVTYSQLAERIGRPAAVRAAGRANGANPIAVVVPCHRVVGADGSLTGYGGGLWRKQWLLEHERRMVNPIDIPFPKSLEENP